MDQIIAALVGGFLAAGTGRFLQVRLEASRMKRLKELLIIGIKDDLKSSVDLYERVIDDWDKSQIVLPEGDIRSCPYYYARVTGVFLSFNIQIDGALRISNQMK